MTAKKALREYVKTIDLKLADYWDSEIALNFGFNDRQKELIRKLLEHSKEHNLRSAKRLRGSFVYFGYLLSGEKPDERIWKASISVEVIHTALLMQDDVMDRDKLRRGKPTTHELFGQGDLHYGEAIANSLGDVLLTVGYEVILESGYDINKIQQALKYLFRGLINTGWGQAFDVALEKFSDWTEEDVIALHKTKTAIYTYKNPLFVGAVLAGMDERVLKILDEYSMDGGVAFQLQDDILGVFGDEEETGKSADSDLKQGKRTLLILKALEMGNEKQKEAIKAVWGKNKAKRVDLDRAKKAIEESGSLDYSRKLAKKLAARAAKTAEKLRELKLNSEAIDYIQGIAEYMVEREV